MKAPVRRIPAAILASLLPCLALAQQGDPGGVPTGPSGPRGPNPHAPPSLRPSQPQRPPQRPPAQDAQKMEKIEVQGDANAERRTSTASKIIVNSEEINKYGDSNVMDVLKRLPGITVDSGPGGRGGAIRMRGLGSGYTQVLVNGERMPPGFSLDSIAPDMIERIEIIRGATAEFSAQAIAGTINVVLKRALSQKKEELRASVSVQNDRPTVFASGQVSDKTGDFSWTVPFNMVRFSFRNEGLSEQRVLGPDASLAQHFGSHRGNEGWGGNVNLSPRLSWALGANNTLNVDAFALAGLFRGYFTEDNTPRTGPPPPYVGTQNRVRNEFTVYRLNTNWVRKFAGDSRLDARVGFSHFDFDSMSDFTARDAGGAFALQRIVDSSASDNTFTTVGKYTFNVVQGHNLSSGWDAAYTLREDVRLQSDFFPLLASTTRRDEDFESNVRRLALYAQDEWDVSERFAMYTGLRWEGIETRSDGNTYDPIRNRSSVLSPIANLLWKLPGSEKDQVRLGISRTYKPINTGDIVPRRFFAPNNSATTPDFIGNPNLKPELSWGVDAGYEHYPAGGGNIGVSLFYRRIEDVVQRQTSFQDGLYVSRPENIGAARVKGIEIDAKGSLTQLVDGAPRVELRANFAVNKSTVDFLPGPFNRLDEQPPWNGTAGADYRFTAVPLTLGTSFTARGAGTVRISTSQVVYRSINRQWEMFALWRFSAKASVRVTVQDLLAQDAIQVNRFTDSAGFVTERSSADPRYRRFSMLWEVKL
jgi:outer membrane receptor protein involved in Fe transport